MGLFDAIGSIFTGANNSDAAKNAASAQVSAEQQGINGIQSQLATTNANYSPYMSAGTSALSAEGALTGLNGTGAQQSAISQLQSSPYYQSLMSSGSNAVLSSGAATGGLRGGNMTNSLATFGANTLASTIQQQLSNLSGISNQGLTATSGDAQAGTNAANAAAQLYTQQGQAQAGGILGVAAGQNQQINGITGSLTGLFGNGSTSGAGSSGSLGSIGSTLSSLSSLAIPFGF